MNITELQEILKKNDINLTGRELSALLGMHEISFWKKKKIGSEIKYKQLKLIEDKFGIVLTNNSTHISLPYLNMNQLLEILELHNINLTNRELAEIWGINENTITNKKRTGSQIKPKYLKLLEDKYNLTLIEECLEGSDFPTAGQRVKFIRESMHLSQEQFAQLLDVSRAFVSAVEKNKVNLSVEKLALLLTKHNASANYILAGIGHPFIPDYPA